MNTNEKYQSTNNPVRTVKCRIHFFRSSYFSRSSMFHVREWVEGERENMLMCLVPGRTLHWRLRMPALQGMAQHSQTKSWSDRQRRRNRKHSHTRSAEPTLYAYVSTVYTLRNGKCNRLHEKSLYIRSRCRRLQWTHTHLQSHTGKEKKVKTKMCTGKEAITTVAETRCSSERWTKRNVFEIQFRLLTLRRNCSDLSLWLCLPSLAQPNWLIWTILYFDRTQAYAIRSHANCTNVRTAGNR